MLQAVWPSIYAKIKSRKGVKQLQYSTAKTKKEKNAFYSLKDLADGKSRAQSFNTRLFRNGFLSIISEN